MKSLINFCIYQIVWFLCIFLENTGAFLALPFIGLHFLLSDEKRKDMHLAVIFLAAGLCIDGVLHAAGFISFNVPAYPIPFWLAVIWVALATLPHHSLKWLKGKRFLSAFLGGIAGPLAYYAGVRAGAADFGWSLTPSLATLSVIWAFFWSVVMHYAGRTNTTGMGLPHQQ